MTDYECIRFTQSAGTAVLTFHRPEVLNALNAQLIGESLDAIGRIDPKTRVLVLRGAGSKAFAAGADLEEMQRRTLWSEIDFGPRRELARRLENAPYLTIAAIDGFALGGGFELALACHLRILSDAAILGLPETSLGILPANGGTARLTRLIGTGRALKLIVFGERIDAHEAERLGIANWIVPADDFDNQVDAIVKQALKRAPVSTRATIDSVIRGADLSIDQAIELEHRWFQLCLATDDKAEGVSAFLERRQAVFGEHP